MALREIEAPRRRGRLYLIAGLLLLLIGARTIASYAIEFQWWKEIDQLSTWLDQLLYGVAPIVGATVLIFIVFWMAHSRGVKLAGISLRRFPLYAKLATLALLVLSWMVAQATSDTWTVVRFFGGHGLSGEATAWHDPVFGRALSFYLFDLPFYSLLLRLLLTTSLIAAVLYWLTARAWQLRDQLPAFRGEFDVRELRLSGATESHFVRAVAGVFLVALSVWFVLGRYDLLLEDHGFMVGVDYVGDKISLPLQWLGAAASLAAAALVLLGRWKMAASMALVLVVQFIVPKAVYSLYVRPNEIALQRPYIQRHIEATRSAYGLNRRVSEVQYLARPEGRIDVAKHKPLLDNVRLWDWRAFHDTVTQIQALRPYYVFVSTDVDRYIIDNQLRQVLLTPRELDVHQLAGAQARWINSHLTYTHGYGMVMAEANRFTPDGLPVLLIHDAPPKVETPSLKFTQPEIYYGEKEHEPVFVRTQQPEFNYPSGGENVHSHYNGKGGFPIDSLGMRLAATLTEGDWNILLTTNLTPESRMMIRRTVVERLDALAGFLTWDSDPYLVLTSEGRQIWMVDGYTTSNVHPYARSVPLANGGELNYIRNAVKATVDAYDGTVRLYNFDPADPILQAYARLFPKLFVPAEEMPAELRAHARFPEELFKTQAEIYRTFHMRDPESFYNKEDLWDMARNVRGQTGQPEPVAPTYVVATLPGEEKAEFLLMIPFTPRNKDNLIGLMLARCDGPHLGEVVVLQLSKQALIFGPMQIEARINQDQNISKDLTLWNQQGSQVLRGQMLVLPIDDTFLYIEPIYIQASEARMPQLKKIALAVGNTLIYSDTYEQALAELVNLRPSSTTPATTNMPPPPVLPGGSPTTGGAPLTVPQDGTAQKQVQELKQHFGRYRDFAAQGKWAEAGKELEAIQGILNRSR